MKIALMQRTTHNAQRSLLILLLLFCQTIFAANNGLLFSTSDTFTTGSSPAVTLAITTTVPNHTYPYAGIKVNTPGQSIDNTSSCTPNANGYCVFSASDTSSTSITIDGPIVPTSITLCLNALGPLSCQTSVISVAYVVNYGSSMVSICPVNNNGTLGACTAYPGNDSTSTNTFDDPGDIAFNPTNTFAYIANYSGSTLSICPVNSDGTFGTNACTASNPGGTFVNPDGIAINQSGTMAYVSNNEDNSANGIVSICPITDAGASLGPCTTTTGNGTFNYLQAIRLHTVGSGTYAYVVSALNHISICPINADGSLGTCTTSTGNGTFLFPAGISFNAAGNIAYVANFDNSTLSICPVNSENGTFGICTTTTGNGTFRFHGGALTAMFMGSPTNYGYVPNTGGSSNTVSICPINANGSLGTCTTTTGSGTFSNPSSVFVATN